MYSQQMLALLELSIRDKLDVIKTLWGLYPSFVYLKKNGGLHFSCWNYQQTVVLSLLGDTFGSLRHRNIRMMKRVVSLTCTWRVNAYYSRIRHNACNFTRISLIKKARKRVCKNVLITCRKSTGTYHKHVLRQECM